MVPGLGYQCAQQRIETNAVQFYVKLRILLSGRRGYSFLYSRLCNLDGEGSQKNRDLYLMFFYCFVFSLYIKISVTLVSAKVLQCFNGNKKWYPLHRKASAKTKATVAILHSEVMVNNIYYSVKQFTLYQNVPAKAQATVIFLHSEVKRN